MKRALITLGLVAALAASCALFMVMAFHPLFLMAMLGCLVVAAAWFFAGDLLAVRQSRAKGEPHCMHYCRQGGGFCGEPAGHDGWHFHISGYPEDDCEWDDPARTVTPLDAVSPTWPPRD